MSISKVPIWLDCDPGHDDAFAILLAATSPHLDLLGISIVHGNDTVEHCALNAKRFMWTCGIQGIPVYPGVTRPILREAKHCPEIHGVPGKDGVAGMCGFHFPDEKIFSYPSNLPGSDHGVLKMVEVVSNHPSKVSLVVTGAQTNVSMAVRLFPGFKDNLHQIVFMGGAIGLGNTGVAAEFNIEIDPEAAHVVFHSGIPLVMVPLEVTHSILVTPDVLETISKISDYVPSAPQDHSPTTECPQHKNIDYEEIIQRLEETKKGPEDTTIRVNEIPNCSSEFSRCCVQLLTFFRSTYKSVFSFHSPPLHDPCAIFYLIHPEAFKWLEMFVDVELGGKCVGRTLCDVHGLSGKEPNVKVCYKVDSNHFWRTMFNSLHIADKKSPLNCSY